MELDHIDGDKLNNRIENLREVSHTENMCNQQTAQRSNKLQVLGVHKKGSKYAAQIRLEGKVKHLGLFDTEQQASSAYQIAKERRGNL